MVAIFVAFMFVSLVLLDLSVEKWKAWRTSLSARDHVSQVASVPATPWQFPDGIRISPAHTWLKPESTGSIEVGADALITYAVGAVRRVILPKAGEQATEGQPLFRLEHNGSGITVRSSVTGQVTAVNNRLIEEPGLLSSDPYGSGWVCRVTPTHTKNGGSRMRLGKEAVMWLNDEFSRFREFILTQLSPDFALGTVSQDGGLPAVGCLGELSQETWSAFEEQFLRG